MYSDWTVFVILTVVVLLWLGFLTRLIRKQNRFLQELFPKNGERDIRKKFEEILELEGKLDTLVDKETKNISKVSLLRYNPYQDTGGDQSFSAAFLDGRDNGLILTSLHSRSGTRVFAKLIKSGKADGFTLSKEEEDAVKKAIQK